MNPQKKIVRHHHAEEQEHTFEAQAAHSNAQEFASVEEMLRHDAMHTPVPPAISRRLQESLDQLPTAPRRPWWRRILGGSSS